MHILSTSTKHILQQQQPNDHCFLVFFPSYIPPFFHPFKADYATSQVSKDMVNWQLAAYVFPSNSSTRPVWAVSDFWAPEIHKISENQFNVYFAARLFRDIIYEPVATLICVKHLLPFFFFFLPVFVFTLPKHFKDITTVHFVLVLP